MYVVLYRHGRVVSCHGMREDLSMVRLVDSIFNDHQNDEKLKPSIGIRQLHSLYIARSFMKSLPDYSTRSLVRFPQVD